MKDATSKLTWQELKDFCNTLPESVMQQQVIAQDEEQTHRIAFAEQTEEDMVNVCDEGCEPLAMYLPGGSLHYLVEEQEIDLTDIRIRKGDPFLFVALPVKP